MALTLKPLHKGYGVTVENVDLTHLSADLVEAILDALWQHALLVFPRQSLHDEDLFELSRAFGPVVEPAATKNHTGRFKEINHISNLRQVGGDQIGGLIPNHEGDWHSDQSFHADPATLSTLFCVHAPATGGSTSFCSTVMGYEALPPPLQDRAATLRGRYKRTNRGYDAQEYPEVTHPAVMTIPGSQRKSLYVMESTKGFLNMADKEALALRGELLRYQLLPEHIYSHPWRMGDMALYDNGQLLHRRDPFDGLRWLKSSRVFLPRKRFAIPA